VERVALVSGANRGIGREVAAQLVALGYRVVVGARDLGKARKQRARSGRTPSPGSSTSPTSRASSGASRGSPTSTAD
jgi:NAD(P)-dependent dehydrogenase (short-subunit alcohol dehydrogenase family)